MSFEAWIAFIVASAALVIIPGPTVLMLIGYGLAKGRSIALVTLPGVALGAGLSILLAVAGLGAILALGFIGVSAVFDTGYALAAGSARGVLKRPSLLRAANRVGGSFMIGAGAAMAAMRRTM